MNQVIKTLEGKIARLDQRSQQVVTEFEKLLNGAIEVLVEILHFQEESNEERFKREQNEWKKEKELLLKEKENEKAEKVRAEAEFKALNDQLTAEKNKPKVCDADCTKDHTNDGACLKCGQVYNATYHIGHNCKNLQ